MTKFTDPALRRNSLSGSHLVPIQAPGGPPGGATVPTIVAAGLANLSDRVAATAALRHQQPGTGGAELALPTILAETMTPLKFGVPLDASPDDAAAVQATTLGMQALFNAASTRLRRRVDCDGRRFALNTPLTLAGSDWLIDGGGAQLFRNTDGDLLRIDVTNQVSHRGTLRDLDLRASVPGVRTGAGVRFYCSTPGTGFYATHWTLENLRGAGMRTLIRFDDNGYDDWALEGTGIVIPQIQRYGHIIIANTQTDNGADIQVVPLTGAGSGTHTAVAPDRPNASGVDYAGDYAAAAGTFTADHVADQLVLASTLYAALRDGDLIQMSSTGTLPPPLIPGADYAITKVGGDRVSLRRYGLPHEVIRWDAGCGAHCQVKGGNLLATDACIRLGDRVAATGDITLGGEMHLLLGRWGIHARGPADLDRYRANLTIGAGVQFDGIRRNNYLLERYKLVRVLPHNANQGRRGRLIDCEYVQVFDDTDFKQRVGMLPTYVPPPADINATTSINLFRISKTPDREQYVTGEVTVWVDLLINNIGVRSLRSTWHLGYSNALHAASEVMTVTHPAGNCRIRLIQADASSYLAVLDVWGTTASSRVRARAETIAPYWTLALAAGAPLVGDVP